MKPLSGYERIDRILRREPVDRIGLCEALWFDTIKKWTAEGHLRENESISAHFGYDLDDFNPFRLMGDIDHEKKVIEETDDAVIYEDGNGVVQKRMKNVTNIPQLIRFKVRTQNDWERDIKPLLKPDRARLNIEGYKKAMAAARQNQQFFFVSSMNVFELMRALCGHETILVAMALEPDWIQDMVDVYARLIVDLMDMLFTEAGQPDGVWFFEDMGFNL